MAENEINTDRAQLEALGKHYQCASNNEGGHGYKEKPLSPEAQEGLRALAARENMAHTPTLSKK